VLLAHLVARVRPQGSSETAAESLLTLDDATALTAAEQIVQRLARPPNGSGDSKQQPASDAAAAAGSSTMDIDGLQQQQAPHEQQLLMGRRLLQALIDGCGDKSKNNSGKRMCFYAQELNAKLGRARGLDLHSVAARLEQGLYAATTQPTEVRAARCVGPVWGLRRKGAPAPACLCTRLCALTSYIRSCAPW
jgi:hypothetical protein